MKKRYGKQFSLLYLPRNPVMQNKRLVTLDRNEKVYHDFIKGLCHELGIPILSMWNSFLNLYSNEKQLQSGYPNTISGVGHLNERGHQVVTNEIIKFLDKEVLE